jgi:hypothetical protein
MSLQFALSFENKGGSWQKCFLVRLLIFVVKKFKRGFGGPFNFEVIRQKGFFINKSQFDLFPGQPHHMVQIGSSQVRPFEVCTY